MEEDIVSRDHAPSTCAATEKTPLPPTLQCLWEDFLVAHDRFETALCAAMGDFERTRHDPYDNSVEVDGVPPETRLSEAAQRVIWEAGFRKAYINHSDGWETHFSWGSYAEPFKKLRGWRRKSKPDGSGFLIGYWPEGWKKTEWLETGYMVIEPDPLEPAVASRTAESSPRQVVGEGPGTTPKDKTL